MNVLKHSGTCASCVPFDQVIEFIKENVAIIFNVGDYLCCALLKVFSSLVDWTEDVMVTGQVLSREARKNLTEHNHETSPTHDVDVGPPNTDPLLRKWVI